MTDSSSDDEDHNPDDEADPEKRAALIAALALKSALKKKKVEFLVSFCLRLFLQIAKFHERMYKASLNMAHRLLVVGGEGEECDRQFGMVPPLINVFLRARVFGVAAGQIGQPAEGNV